MRFKNYRNPYTNDNRIYSFKDLYNMPFGELIRHKQEVLGQYRVLGVPTEQELQGSENVVHVEAYTRDDGTEVKAHYRSKPNCGSITNANSTQENSNKEGTQTGEVSSVSNKAKEQKIQEQASTLETTTTKEEKLYPEEIAGVKRGKPMTKNEAGGTNVNPNYNSEDVGYKVNCSYCSVVYRARQLGYDIEALPVRNNDTQDGKLLQKYPYYAYENPNGTNIERPTKYRSNNSNECLQNIEKQVKIGEEHIMWYQPKDSTEGLAHVINISRNENNELEFYDSQNGQTYGKEYVEKMDFVKQKDNELQYYPQYFFRVDNKVLKEDVVSKISRPAQRHSK